MGPRIDIGTGAGLLPTRREQVVLAGAAAPLSCEKPSAAGSVSQRACVFCGSRVVLYPIADALHLVHGPIGCAAYTWDIRGALSSGPELHRMSFCTDLRETDVIHGGEKKLAAALDELVARFKPAAAFVYATCITGIIGDDIGAVCRAAAKRLGIPVVPVHSEGFKGTKKDGYRAACEALFSLIREHRPPPVPFSVNLVGEFNVAGETWLIRDYFEKMGLTVVATLTGDGRVEEVRRAGAACLNIVQCSGSMTSLAVMMRDELGIPFIRASFFGIEDTAQALYDTADFFNDPAISERTAALVRAEIDRITPELASLRKRCNGRIAGVYVGGAFKAISLVKALRRLGIRTAVAGTQTGNAGDYALLRKVCDSDTVIVDDTNPFELASFLLEKNVDIFIGGVKERPLAFKLGIGFCDHNHERKTGLAGFSGMLAFGREVCASVTSPVWKLVPRRSGGWK